MKILGIRERSVSPLLSGTILACCGLALSGCLAGPTYGTGTGSHEQLLQDVSGILTIAPKSNDERIEYKPRPQLVQPASTEVLPQPQESVVAASASAWPESPEARRKRIRDEATLNRDDPGFRPEVESPQVAAAEQPVMRTRGGDIYASSASSTGASQREEFNRRLAISKQGSPTARRYLSEPPLDYRQPSEAAPVDDVGEDEWKKQKRLKREARKEGDSSWRDLVPWL